jgi:UDP-3-O-[3-hydroxymyristoyl] glucosamine N-acyltransferase
MNIEFTAKEICSLFPEATLKGSQDKVVNGFAALKDAKPNELTFLGGRKYIKDLEASDAGIVLVSKDFDEEPKEGVTYILVANPSDALSFVCKRVEAQLRPRPQAGIHPMAIVDSSATIDPTAYIGPGCVVQANSVIGAGCYLEAQIYIGHNVKVGDCCDLMAQVSIADNCILGNRVRLHSGVRIGADGFGYTQEGSPPDMVHVKVPQIGNVVIEDDVEIGANTCVDRARFGETRIGMGTKIDNLVQIGHNVQIGRHCILCAEVGISGTTIVGDYVVFWGQSATAGHIHIGSGSFIAGQAGVNCNLPEGSKVSGTPAYDYFQERRAISVSKQLPDMLKRIKSLEKRLDK